MHLVHDEQVGLQLAQNLDIVAGAVVGDNLIRNIQLVLTDALVMQALDDVRLLTRKPFNFALPLILQGCGTDNESRLYQFLLAHQFGSADGLNGLAKTHLVGNDAPALREGESDALFLIRIEWGGEQLVEHFVSIAMQDMLTEQTFSFIDDKVDGILIETETVADTGGLLGKFFYMVIGIL